MSAALVSSRAGPAPIVAAAASVAPPTPADRTPNPNAAAHPFAELLRQNRRADASTPPATAKADHTTAAAEARSDTGETAAPEAVAAAPRRTEAMQARARAAGATKPAGKADASAASSPGAEETRASDADAHAKSASATGADAGATTNGPASRPETAPPARDAAGPSTAADAARAGSSSGRSAVDADALDGDLDPTTSGTDRRTAGSASTSRGGPSRRDAPTLGRGSDVGAGERFGATPGGFAQALGERTTSDAVAPAAAPGATFAGATPTAALAEPTRGDATPADPATATAAIPVPVDAPEFAAAIGVQVSVFAKDGVQHAELHLNPAEMGPVSIAITLDGTQARVDFGADVAATRQALENGLPELAGALRDAGFTLAGGGVAQHAQTGGGGPNDGADGRGRSDRPPGVGTTPAAEPAAVRTTRRVSAGGVDLYA